MSHDSHKAAIFFHFLIQMSPPPLLPSPPPPSLLSPPLATNILSANSLNLIALAHSGYTPQETRLWHETCSGMKAQISNPYLRAAFNFLCSNGRDGFKDVLVSGFYWSKVLQFYKSHMPLVSCKFFVLSMKATCRFKTEWRLPAHTWMTCM